VLSCLAVALLIAVGTTAEARTRRDRKRDPGAVVLQPFLLARSAIHAVADPMVFNAPRVVTTAATAPLRLAFHSGRPWPANTLHEDESDDDEGSDETERRARLAELAEDEPINVAYNTNRVRRPKPPRPEQEQEEISSFEKRGSQPPVAGNCASLRNGVACAPTHAPTRVKKAIWAANSLRRKPYVWGGGHGSFNDRGYDCSGTISFALHHAGVLASPLPSSDFMRYGERGRGHWITIYSRPGHTFAMIAGLRLDTTDFDQGGNTGPRWHADMRNTSGYVARHPAGM